MGRSTKEEKFKFSFTLLVGNTPTIDGNIYPTHVLMKMVERFHLMPRVIVQEMNIVERKVKNISISEPWEQKTMGYIVNAQLINNMLELECECKTTRDGKKLSGMVQSLGINTLEFFPVGYGTVDDRGLILPDYRISYIAVEPKHLTR